MDQRFEQRLKQCTKLPSLPTVAIQLVDAAGQPDLDPDDIETIISKDPALAAKVIRVANSPLYGQLHKTQNLSQAIIKLGLHSVITLSLSFSIIQNLRPSDGSRLLELWKRSFIASIVARLIGQLHHLPNVEDLFLAALLQDIGILAFDAVDSEYLGMLQETKTHQDILRLERQIFNTDHTEVGHWLLKRWNFPELLCDSVQFSDDLTITDDDEDKCKFMSVIALSGRIADIWLHPSVRQASFTAMIANQKLVQLSDEQFQSIIDFITTQMEGFGTLFDLKLFNSQQAEQIQETASEVLAIRNLTLLREIRREKEKIEVLEEEKRELEEQVKRDPLTGLYNRRYLDQIIALEFNEAVLRNWSLTAFFIDLDNFKEINDNYGHTSGDDVLKCVARYLEKQLRRSDIVCRYGGEEFLILLPDTSLDNAQRLAERLHEGIGLLPCSSVDGNQIRISTSIGVACHDKNHVFEDAQALTTAADKMLYKAKHAGRNRIEVYRQPGRPSEATTPA
ncbi:diguanylate cyclase [Pokkaliibacter sp. CJK22405]|uniref:sensor domain-containing diguanylate cyclase n=1 Tax=Pokkaliibacter sp. CJK22405 TaxID=3384615 RepID=UPI0039850C25